MASLQVRDGRWQCQFFHHGKRRTFALGKVTEAEAKAKAAQVDYLLLRLKQRLIELPPGVGIAEFLQHDGKPPVGLPSIPERQALTLTAFRDRYLDTHRGSLEIRTVDGIDLHFKHLIAAMGERFPIGEMKLSDLQGYVEARAKTKHRGKAISPATIKKEIITLRTAWNWAMKMELVAGRFPYDGLRYPKSHEKPPFMTRDEIDRQMTGADLKPHQKTELWHALYLQTEEIAEALDVVKRQANHDWIYAMACTAAHTGARRSELIRMRTTDVDFSGGTVVIREKKRVRGQHSTRRVPLTEFLADVLRAYLKSHPGGNALFCHQIKVGRSKKRSPTTGHQSGENRSKTVSGRSSTVNYRDGTAPAELTEDETHDHLKRALSGSRWSVIKGWHVWRHAFISACASKGVDQRFIDEWAGHQSEAMKRRYRHLAPSVQASALKGVFS